jgi:hypothetical protein
LRESEKSYPTPPVFCVNAVDKGVSERFGVKAVDKGLSGCVFRSRRSGLEQASGAGAGVFARRVRNSIAGKELACLGGEGKVTCRANIMHVSR